MQRAKRSTSSGAEFAWTLGPSTGAVPAARHAFEAFLRAHGVGDDDVQDLAVVLSELASNATIAAPPGTAGLVHASLSGSRLELEVSNEVAQDDVDVVRWDLDDPLRGGGRGLLIVRAYTDAMEVDSDGGSVTVRCTRRLEPRP